MIYYEFSVITFPATKKVGKTIIKTIITPFVQPSKGSGIKLIQIHSVFLFYEEDLFLYGDYSRFDILKSGFGNTDRKKFA